MNKKEQNITTVWQEYQKGVDYNYQHQLYEKSKRNYNFYHGNQWEGAKLQGIRQIHIKYFLIVIHMRIKNKEKNYKIYVI